MAILIIITGKGRHDILVARELCRAANVERTAHHMKPHRDRETKGSEVYTHDPLTPFVSRCSLCVPCDIPKHHDTVSLFFFCRGDAALYAEHEASSRNKGVRCTYILYVCTVRLYYISHMYCVCVLRERERERERESAVLLVLMCIYI
jgi:hypothetical protein